MVITDQGYEIHVRERDILLVDRKLWGPGFALFGLTMIAGVLLVLGILGIADLVDLRSRVSEYGLLLGAIVVALPTSLLVRGFNERRRLPLDEVAGVLVIDLESNALRNRMGEILAQLDDVRAAMHIDWMTRGVARWWCSGGRVDVAWSSDLSDGSGGCRYWRSSPRRVARIPGRVPRSYKRAGSSLAPCRPCLLGGSPLPSRTEKSTAPLRCTRGTRWSTYVRRRAALGKRGIQHGSSR